MPSLRLSDVPNIKACSHGIGGGPTLRTGIALTAPVESCLYTTGIDSRCGLECSGLLWSNGGTSHLLSVKDHENAPLFISTSCNGRVQLLGCNGQCGDSISE